MKSSSSTARDYEKFCNQVRTELKAEHKTLTAIEIASECSRRWMHLGKGLGQRSWNAFVSLEYDRVSSELLAKRSKVSRVEIMRELAKRWKARN